MLKILYGVPGDFAFGGDFVGRGLSYCCTMIFELGGLFVTRRGRD